MRYYITILLAFATIFSACNRDDTPNLSPVTSIPLGIDLGVIMGYDVDQSGKFLYISFFDLTGGAAHIKKIRLSDLSEIGTFSTQDFVLLNGNLVVTKDNQLIISAYAGYHTINKFSPTLTPTGADTTVVGNALFRKAFCKGLDGNIYYAANLKDTSGRTYTRFAKINDDVSSTIIWDDSTFAKGITYFPRQFHATPDGGYIVTYRTISPPIGDVGLAFEKRDAQFKLQWQQRYDPPGAQTYGAISIVGNNLYISGHNLDAETSKTNFFGLKYDMSGNQIYEKSFTTGALDDKRIEPLIPTEDGGFLLTALTSATTGITQRKGVLFKVDADFNVIKSQLFGGQVGVTSSGLIKLAANDYLLFYMDDGFKPDGTSYRLVMRHIDANGNFIE